MAKMLVRAASRPRSHQHVEGMRRWPEHDFSMAVPFGFISRDTSAPDMRIAAVCHIFFPELSAEIRVTLGQIPGRLDVVVSTDTQAKCQEILAAFAGWDKGMVDVRLVANRGRDIAPKLTAYRDVHDEYDLVLYLHSKRTTRRLADGSIWHDGSDWRRYLLHNLAGSPEIAGSVLAAFHRDPRLGIVMAQHWEPIRGFVHWTEEYFTARALARRMGIRLTPAHVIDFPSGSMFWARPAAIKPLLDLDLRVDDFPEETGQIGGTPAHAVERLFLFACEAAGYRWVKVCDRSLSSHPQTVISINTPADLEAYRRRHGFRLTALGPA